MTFWAFLWLQMGIAVAIMGLSLITIIGHIWTTKTGRRRYTRRWYDDTWLSPGIYRLYGDGAIGVGPVQRIIRYAIGLLLLLAFWETVGSLLGFLVLKDVLQSDIYEFAATTTMRTPDYILYFGLLAYLLIHFFSIPQSRFLKTMRVVLPFSALFGFAVGVVGSVVFEFQIIRRTAVFCRWFSDTGFCEVIG